MYRPPIVFPQSKPTGSMKLISYSLTSRPLRKNLLSTITTTTIQATELGTDDRPKGSDNQIEHDKNIKPSVRKAFQESLIFLKKDSEQLETKLNLIKSSSQNVQTSSFHEQSTQVERIEILSQINDYQIRKNHRLGLQVDMSKPIYRFLKQQQWSKGGRLGRLMETTHRLRIFPDLFPSFDPQVDLKIKFQPDHDQNPSERTRFINIGNFVPSSKSMSPPTIQVQVFHVEPRLYTIMMVDTDVPDPENHTFTSFLHWFVPNVSISATTNGELGLKSSDVKEGKSRQLIDYIGPHPAEGSGQHRYTILIFEQDQGSIIDINDHSKSLERVGFSTRKISELFNLKPVGILAWVSQWHPRDATAISTIYTDQLKIPEPRYGPEPKPFNPRVKLPSHTKLPLTHRHPTVIPWRERSSEIALKS